MASLAAMAALAVLVALATACTPVRPSTYAPGQTDYVSEVPGYPSSVDGGAAPGTGGSGAGSGGSSGSANPMMPGASNPPGGRVAEVEEGDIYRIDGNRLFYLNTYRGFVI